ncbi:hypothetical protein [Cytobacillus horneckiae]|uniref:Uncharacterized protein n=1 Tax=Cytobacillus horneckiae TaxID=549687 RepID=A0A2N0ZB53_9BACI|nr:hypothetical protein [Cytobacillus horneckiae]MEC1155531.1 hypothetical protein [Cytobacillus horneckiae]MED2936850.1 hypothetical protein [Cytobacillus horneckiae]PKG26730.1 hypothetical protein CWS20_22375 [Cytobacillus horneckiae]
MNQFEKEFNLDKKFPRFKINSEKKQELLNNLLEQEEEITIKTKKKNNLLNFTKKTSNIVILAATFLLMFGALFGIMTYQSANAALYDDDKIINDVNIGIEKSRNIFIPQFLEQSGIETKKDAEKLLSNYFSGNALTEMINAWESNLDTNLSSPADLEGSVAEISMGSLNNSKNIKINELENKNRSVSYYDINIDKNIKLECELINKKWVIYDIKIN